MVFKKWLPIISMKNKTIVYVNFAPYDNAGRILDYLIENFSVVIHFSYDHLRLKNGRRSKLAIYRNGLLIKQKNLFWLRTNPFLLFPSLPFVATAIMIQTLWYVIVYRKIFGKFDLFFSVNAFTAWEGNLLRFLKLVNKTIYWVWDYFPPTHPDIRMRIARWGYWKFDKPSRDHSDKVVFLNKHLQSARKEKNGRKELTDKNKKYPIIPIGTNPRNNYITNRNIIIGHLGMLKREQGLDLLFDNLKDLQKIFPNIKVEIIGSGPEENHFKARAKKFAKIVKFFGYVERDDDVDRIMKNWSMGIATYVPIKWSEHYWTDPSKIKAYLNQGLPVITTNVPEFAQEIENSKAGIVINYYKNQEFIEAIKKIIKERKEFNKNALLLAEKYNYRMLYPKIFS